MTYRHILLGTLGAIAMISAAAAHPMLKAAGPIPGSTVKTAPKMVRIQFSEALELAFSGVELKNKDGAVQATGPAALDPNNKAILVVPITAALAPGAYTVNWHAVGDDTHRMEGHYDFELKP